MIFLFGALAAGLGFRVERLQTAFPDCEAKREIVPGKWERVLIEFEFESRNFRYQVGELIWYQHQRLAIRFTNRVPSGRRL